MGTDGPVGIESNQNVEFWIASPMGSWQWLDCIVSESGQIWGVAESWNTVEGLMFGVGGFVLQPYRKQRYHGSWPRR